MSIAQQSMSSVRKTQQAMSVVAEVSGEWVAQPPAPRPISAVRGRMRVPADGPLVAVPLADHTMLHLTLVPEPAAQTGWLVTSIKH